MIKKLTMEKTSLPIGWETKTLGEVCEILDNLRKPITKRDRIEGEYPYYGATGILSYINDYIFDEKLVLIGEDGAKWFSGANSSFIVNGKYWVNNHAHVIRPNRTIILDEWIVYFLNFSDLEEFVTGMTVPKLNQGNLKIIPIPLPPLPQQKQIVAILDKAFAAIDIAKANAKQNLQNAKELFESYLQNVFENKGDDWEEKTLGKVTSKIGSGATPRGGKASYKEEGISLIRSMNVHDFYFKKKNLAFIDDKQADALSNVTLQEKDVLLNITGASIARCCMIPKEYLPARVNQHVSIIRAKKDIINPVFLASLLTSKYFKDQILEIGEQGATRQAITKVQLENFHISYPKEIEEQEKVIQNINLIKAQTKKLEAIYIQKIADLEEMKKSVLQKAFSGQLNTIN
jgi:type I restriction enzyme S subunit